MKFYHILLFCFLHNLVYAQQNMDTIYGQPKSVREKVLFLNENKPNYKYFETDGDYGHSMIFNPKNVKNRFLNHWYNNHNCFYINYFKEFHENGKAKYEIWYDKKGNLKRKYEYMYDKNGRIVQIKESDYNSKYVITNITYNFKGKVISTLNYLIDYTNMYSYDTYKYDDSGNLILHNFFDEEGYQYSTFYKYNSNNQLIEKKKHSSYRKITREDGITITKFNDSIGTYSLIGQNKYDSNGNKIETINFKHDTNEVKGRTIYTYDNDNNLTYEGYINDTTLHSYNKYHYNKENLKIGYYYSLVKFPIFNKTVLFNYNDDHYIEEVIYKNEGKKYKINYHYVLDDKGNWIKTTKIVNGEPLYVWTREI